MATNILSLCYLLGSITFIVGLKMLSAPLTARKGNLTAASGMIIAIVGTLLLYKQGNFHLHNYGWILSGLSIGAVGGTIVARKIRMTEMPEMVSLFNGMGGLCAALISLIEFGRLHELSGGMAISGTAMYLLIIVIGLIVGSISFAGSLIAFGKLHGMIKQVTVYGRYIINLVLPVIILSLVIYLLQGNPHNTSMVFYTILIFSLIYGALFVLPIGGADMPVVISLLNSFTGVATAFGGLLYHNPVMLTGGVLVGAAGTILTILMCKAMNRSLKNVLFGSFGNQDKNTSNGIAQQAYKATSVSDVAILLRYANKVIIVPGYGLAVAQAQHNCHELEKLLSALGVQVAYAIHPVAGRMPGHMNVLLAEADVPYEELLDLDRANEELETADVALILGANDVVNPAAKNDPDSPIYGMPIIEVEKAKAVIVNKRSMRPGYSGIENALFFKPNVSMLFGDTKDILQQLVETLKTI